MREWTRRRAITGLAALAARPAFAQTTTDWIIPDWLRAAKTEGGLTVYSSQNEQEGLPLWKLFEAQTGIQVSYVRASDVQLLSRIAIEGRARQRSWDIVVSTAASKIQPDQVAPVDLPNGRHLMKGAVASDKRWHGVYAHYNAPAFNTKSVNIADLPKSYDDFATRKDLRGRVAIDVADREWLYAMFQHFGEAKADKLVRDLIETLQPVMVDGHLQLARAVASGEYLFALSNYVSLTLNQKLAGGTTDYFGLDPVTIFFGSVAVSAQAPHPNTAKLAANFLLSMEAQQHNTKAGRIPVRPDVTPNPPDAVTRLGARNFIPAAFSVEDERKWQKTFQDYFRRK
jgi:iron(III) transport system substrate-binding protein